MNLFSKVNAAPYSLPGSDDITRQELANGMVILSRANFASPSVVINGLLPAGALSDPDEKLGLADFTAAALMRGTQDRSFHEIYNALESTGASLSFIGGTHSTSFSGRALVEDLDTLLALLSEALRQPIFPADQVERLRDQLLASLAIRAQDTSDMASLAFDQIVYRHHPYSRPEDGYPETVQTIEQADLAAFHRLHYGPRGVLMAIVGGIDPGQAVEKVAQVLGDWQNPQQPPSPVLPPVEPLKKVTSQRLQISGKSQADIILGVAGPARQSPDYLAASLGNSVFGQFGMMGRIGQVVREERGLAYYVSSSLGGGPGPGPWDVEAGVDPENVEPAIDLIIQEIRRFVKETISDSELADNQANYIGRLPVSMESNIGVTSALISLERYQLGLDYYRRYPDLVRSITATQVLEASRRYLDPERLGIAIAGP